MIKKIIGLVLAVIIVLSGVVSAATLPDQEIKGEFMTLHISVTTPHEYLGKVSLGNVYFPVGWDPDTWDPILEPRDYRVKVFVIDDSQLGLTRDITIIPNEPITAMGSIGYYFFLSENGRLYSSAGSGWVQNFDGDFSNKAMTFSAIGFSAGNVGFAISDTMIEWIGTDFDYSDFVITTSELVIFRQYGILPTSITEYPFWNEKTNALDVLDLSKHLNLTALKNLLFGITPPTDQDGNPVTIDRITEIEEINIDVTEIENLSVVRPIITFLNGGKMLSGNSTMNYSVENDILTIDMTSVEVPPNITDVRIFVWDNLQTMRPLMNMIEIN